MLDVVTFSVKLCCDYDMGKLGDAVITISVKKTLRETQTLRAGCSKVEPKNFALLQTPFPGAWDSQNLISWRWSLPAPTNPVW